MIELSFSTSIARPPSEVFSILIDFETYLARLRQLAEAAQ